LGTKFPNQRATADYDIFRTEASARQDRPFSLQSAMCPKPFFEQQNVWKPAVDEETEVLTLHTQIRSQEGYGRGSSVIGFRDLKRTELHFLLGVLDQVSCEINKSLMLFDFTARKWTQWGYPTWSQNGKFLYFDRTSTNTPGYSRVKIGQTHSEFLVDVKEVRRGIPSPLGPWATIAPDGSALFERDLSTSQIYALDLELP
jgi:hypothetical protein